MKLEKLPQHNWNTNEMSPRNTWMFRGLENSFRISKTDLDSYLHSDNVISAQELNLPVPIRLVQFVAASNCLYFTTPKNPKTIAASFVPSPSNWRKVSSKSPLPNVKTFDGDVVALSATYDHLFVLTLNRSRTTSNYSWQIHRVEVHPDKGFHDTKQHATAHITLPYEYIDNNHISFTLGQLTTNEILFFLIPYKGTKIYWGEFRHSTKVTPSILHLDLIKNPPLEDTYLSITTISPKKTGLVKASSKNTVRLLVANSLDNRLFEILNDGSNNRVVDISHGLTLPSVLGSSAVAKLSFNTSDLGMALEPINQTIHLYLLACPKLKQIWTLSDIGEQRILPLIGGGLRNLNESYFGRNLLRYDIGEPDSLCVVDYRCLIFGERDKKNWGVLLLPGMLDVFIKQKLSKLKKDMRPSSYDDYLS